MRSFSKIQVYNYSDMYGNISRTLKGHVGWTDRVRNEEILLRVKEQNNIVHVHEISKRKANWIRHILRRNGFLRQIIEEKIKGGVEVS
jgi:hypothetical protein